MKRVKNVFVALWVGAALGACSSLPGGGASEGGAAAAVPAAAVSAAAAVAAPADPPQDGEPPAAPAPAADFVLAEPAYGVGDGAAVAAEPPEAAAPAEALAVAPPEAPPAEALAVAPPEAAPAEAAPPQPPAAPAVAAAPPAAAAPPQPPATVKAVERAPPPFAAASPPVLPPPVGLPARGRPEESAPRERENASRSVRALVGQLVEVPYRGTGWVFLGEAASQRGLSYDSRRLDEEGQTFVFRAEQAGEYSLKFNKQDFVRNLYANDAVQVSVGADAAALPPSYLGSVRAVAEPRWPPPSPLPAAPAAAAPAPFAQSADEGGGGGAEPSPVEPPPAPPPDYIAQARAAAEAGNHPAAIAALDLLRATAAPDDEAWWLYGQSFEANSPARDVKAALDAYRHITRDFPESLRFQAAQGRMAYLNKFYFDIR